MLRKKILMSAVIGAIIALVITLGGHSTQAKASHALCPLYTCITPTPTPLTVNDCDLDGDSTSDTVTHEASECKQADTTITPTPSPLPDTTSTQPATPSTSAPQPQAASSTTNAPAAVTCTIPFSAPVLNGFTADGNGSVTFSWLESETGLEKYSIIYGYSEDNLAYGEDAISPDQTSVTINGLQAGNHVFAQLWAWKHGCAEMSNIFDPIVL